MADSETLGQRIRRMRTDLRLSQADLASEGVSASYISLIEAGRREPTPATLDAIADKLGTSRAYLVTGRGPASDPGADDSAQDLAAVQLDLSYAELVLRNGDPAESGKLYAAIGMNPAHGFRREIVRSANWGLARSHEALGEPRAAIPLLASLSASSTPVDSHPSSAQVATALARCYRESGDLGAAIRTAEDVMRTLGEAGDPAYLDLSSTLVDCYYVNGDWELASVLADETIRKADASESRRARGTAYWSASRLAQGRGDLGLALTLSEQAVALLAEEEASRNAAAVRIHRAWILLSQETPEAAAALELLRPVERRLEEDGDDLPLAYCRLEIARALLYLAQPEEADTLSHFAASAFARASNTEMVASAHVVSAQALSQMGRNEDARTAVAAATTVASALPSRRSNANLWHEIAREWRRLGDVDEAFDAYGRALTEAKVALPPQPPVSVAQASNRPKSSGRKTTVSH